jgi:uncharacterized membrane protein (UPF0182 family)
MVPFNPARKDNSRWMARADGRIAAGHGLCSPAKLVYGPRQIESRIDQSPNISQQLTLGSAIDVIRGNLLVIPVLNSVLYVQPLYLAASSGGGGLPQLTRVIVAYSDHIAMEATLEAALNTIFGSGTMATSTQAATARAAGGRRLLPLHRPVRGRTRPRCPHPRSQSALRARAICSAGGDFAGYGERRQTGRSFETTCHTEVRPPHRLPFHLADSGT